MLSYGNAPAGCNGSKTNATAQDSSSKCLGNEIMPES